MTKIHLFDFDGTITRHDSFTGFIRHVHGVAGLLRVLFVSAPAIILWKTGFRSNTYAKLRMFAAAFKGMHADEFRHAGETYAAKINRMVRPEIKAALNAAVSHGETTAIVSASLGDWIRPWAAGQGVGNVIATEAETGSDGRLTGRFSRPNCQHSEKVRRIIEAFPHLADSRSDFHVTAYGDSDGDSDMLGFADEGIRVRHS